MAEPCISQTQTLKNLGSIDLLGDRDGPALQRNVNHGSPPGGLHSALPLAQAHPGEPLKRPVGRVTSRLFGGGGQGKGAKSSYRFGALSPLSSYQLVIAYKGLPLASLISLFQYFSTSAAWNASEGGATVCPALLTILVKVSLFCRA